MSQFERYGTRDLSYSHWHRHLSRGCTYDDVDGKEYCSSCKETLLFVETKLDFGQSTVIDTLSLYKLSIRANVPSVSIFVKVDDEVLCDCGQTERQVTAFRVRKLWPVRGDLEPYTLDEWGDVIERIHDTRCDTHVDDRFSV